MPKRLEKHFNNLNKNNMDRRMKGIYKWSVGKKNKSKEGYDAWIEKVADWFEIYAKTKKPLDEEGKPYQKNEEGEFVTPDGKIVLVDSRGEVEIVTKKTREADVDGKMVEEEYYENDDGEEVKINGYGWFHKPKAEKEEEK